MVFDGQVIPPKVYKGGAGGNDEYNHASQCGRKYIVVNLAV